MMKRNLLLGLLLSSLFTPSLFAEEDVDDVIRKSLSRAIPAEKIGAIGPSPVAGFREVQVGISILYVSDDGRYVLRGSLLDMESRADLTEQRVSSLRQERVAGVDQASMIVYPAEEEKYTVTVFTDIDCGYCRKLHGHMDDYNKAGITVRYLSFPRSGPDSEGYNKAISVWCAEDRNTAMTEAKQGKDPGRSTCDNPVRDHQALGVELGVSGTPAIIMQDGGLLPGYLPPKKLVERLEQASAS